MKGERDEQNDEQIVAICIASEVGVEAHEIDEVIATAGAGLKGDRYFAQGADAETQVTLIELEAIESFNRVLGLDLAPRMFRRNLVTRSVRLNDLVGRSFSVGEATLRGVELCEPCAYLQDLLAVPSLVKHLTHRGGLRCEILTGGTLRVGDRIKAT